MPVKPHLSPSSRTVGVLFAIGVLIAFAGLAGLGATVIFDTAPSRDPVSEGPGLHTDPIPPFPSHR